MTSSKVLLILGSGPNIGANTASVLSEKGYKVATTSRKTHTSDHGPTDLHIQADLSDPSTIPSIFTQVKSHFGPPTVIVYTAAALNLVPADDPFSLPVSSLEKTLQVTVTTAYAAIQSAVKLWSLSDPRVTIVSVRSAMFYVARSARTHPPGTIQ